jgi:hypothetical protein
LGLQVTPSQSLSSLQLFMHASKEGCTDRLAEVGSKSSNPQYMENWSTSMLVYMPFV